MHDNPKIVSVQLSIDAYQKSGSMGCGSGIFTSRARSPSLVKFGTANGYSNVNIRETKVSVINSLHRKSNAGMVNLTDVAIALDHLLKR